MDDKLCESVNISFIGVVLSHGNVYHRSEKTRIIIGIFRHKECQYKSSLFIVATSLLTTETNLLKCHYSDISTNIIPQPTFHNQLLA